MRIFLWMLELWKRTLSLRSNQTAFDQSLSWIYSWSFFSFSSPFFRLQFCRYHYFLSRYIDFKLQKTAEPMKGGWNFQRFKTSPLKLELTSLLFPLVKNVSGWNGKATLIKIRRSPSWSPTTVLSNIQWWSRGEKTSRRAITIFLKSLKSEFGDMSLKDHMILAIFPIVIALKPEESRMIARVTFLSNVTSLRDVGMSHYCDRLVAGGLYHKSFPNGIRLVQNWRVKLLGRNWYFPFSFPVCLKPANQVF